ncbi:MAG: YgiT-type zinc finger protein [Phycisphaerales bacterium]|nr:YgiT-type zinc finger protein [Phycisphaerales bacterium]
MCGSRRVHREFVEAKSTSGPMVQVEADVCPNCGEWYFDPAAMRILER